MNMAVEHQKELLATLSELQGLPPFHFLKSTIEEVDLLQELIKRCRTENPEIFKTPTDNGIITSKGDFNSPDYLLDLFYLKNLFNDNKKDKISEHKKETQINYYIEKAIENLFTFSTQGKTHKVISNMFNTPDEKELLRETITRIVEINCFTSHQKSEDKTKITLKASSLNIDIGTSVLSCFSSLNPELHSLSKIINASDSLYTKIVLNDDKSLNLLTKIYKSILDDDYSRFCSICSQELNLSNKIPKIFKIFKAVFSYDLAKRFRSKILSMEVKEQAENFFASNTKVEDFTVDYKKEMINLGVAFSDQLVENKLFQEKSPRHKKQSITYNIVNPLIILNLFNKVHFTKPVFYEKQVSKDFKEDAQTSYFFKEDAQTLNFFKEPKNIFDMLREQHETKIHTHKDINIEIKDIETLQDLNFTKFSINRDYLNKFLLFLKDLLLSPTNPDKIKYYLMFDIDIEELRKLNTDKESQYAKDLEFILELGLDLNDHMYNDFYEKFKKSPDYTFKNMLKKLFENMRINKLFLINCLKECIYYSQARYFMHTSYIDARGRVYLNAVYTNVHNYKLCKAFVTLYNPEISNERVIANAVKDNINTLDIKKELITKLNQNESKQKAKNQMYLEDIKKCFNDTVSIQQIKSLLKKKDDHILDFILQNIKEKDQLFVLHSKICHMANILHKKEDQYISMWYGKDAKCSGLQMLSIFFKSESLGKLSNLIGNDKIDIYSCALQNFNTIIENLNYFYEYCNKDLVDIEQLAYQIKPQMNFRLYNINNICAEYKSKVPILANFSSKNVEYSIEELFDILAKPLDKETLQELQKEEYSSYYKNLVLYKIISKLLHMQQRHPKLPEVFKNRKLFKLSIMTYFYNATSFRRHYYTRELLRSYVQLIKLKKNEINFICNFVEKTFQAFLNKSVPESVLVKKLTSMLAEKKTKVVINSEIFRLEIFPQKYQKYKIQSISYNKVRGKQFIIRIPNNSFDDKEFNKSFSANCTHSMDAILVHFFIRLLTKINKICNSNINFTFNHDNFYITHPLYLEYILKECYHLLFNLNYLSCIENLTEEEKKELLKAENFIFKINPNFIT